MESNSPSKYIRFALLLRIAYKIWIEIVISQNIEWEKLTYDFSNLYRHKRAKEQEERIEAASP